MRLEGSEYEVRVFLSRRNLLSLVAKLDGYPKDSACKLVYDTKDGKRLIVTAEEDAVHYANPERDTTLAGPCHPDTEARLKENL